MKLLTCPDCGAHAKRFTGRPYCDQCGWKVAEAKSRLAPGIAILIAFPVILVFGGATLYGIVLAAGGPPSLGYALLGGVIFALAWWYGSHREVAGRLRDLAERFASRPTKPLTLFSEAEREQYAWLLTMGRPRPIRMPIKAKLTAVGTAVFVAVWLWFAFAPLRENPRPDLQGWDFLRAHWLPILAAMMTLLTPIWLVRDLHRQRCLLTQGKVAIARISRVRERENDRKLEFEFKDENGKTWQGQGLDRTNEMWEGMVVPVFYDQDDPGNHMPICGTYYQIQS